MGELQVGDRVILKGVLGYTKVIPIPKYGSEPEPKSTGILLSSNTGNGYIAQFQNNSCFYDYHFDEDDRFISLEWYPKIY